MDLLHPILSSFFPHKSAVCLRASEYLMFYEIVAFEYKLLQGRILSYSLCLEHSRLTINIC